METDAWRPLLAWGSSDAELISFITGNITKGLIPMSISESEIACSSFTAAAEDGDRRRRNAKNNLFPTLLGFYRTIHKKSSHFNLFTAETCAAVRRTASSGRAGGCVNDVVIHLATSAMGFGGVGESGMGAYTNSSR